MRILLDECLPRELGDELTGDDVRTTLEQGRSGVENGELLQRAAGSFAAFLTIDKHIEQREQIPGALAVITIRARSNRIQSLRSLVPEILEALQDLKPGRSVRVGA